MLPPAENSVVSSFKHAFNQRCLLLHSQCTDRHRPASAPSFFTAGAPRLARGMSSSLPDELMFMTPKSASFNAYGSKQSIDLNLLSIKILNYTKKSQTHHPLTYPRMQTTHTYTHTHTHTHTHTRARACAPESLCPVH